MKRTAEEAALLDVVGRRAMIPAAPHSADKMTEDTDTAAPHRVSMIPLSTSSTTTALSSSSTTPSLMSSRLSSSSLSSSNNDVRTFTRFINARLLQRDGSLNMGTLTVDSASGIITQITFDSQQVTAAAAADSSTSVGGDDDQIVDTVDCRGMILSPGFIDLQLNGAYGVDFSNGDCSEEERGDGDGKGSNNGGLCTEDIMRVANSLCQTGCTSFCPTMVSSSCHTYRRVLPLMRRARKQQQQQRQQLRQGVVTDNGTKIGASILGMHLEGPFFDPAKRGAHDERHIVAPSEGINTVREVYGLTREDQNVDNESSPILKDIDIITLAPELDGGLKATKSLTSSGVVVSCGHTGATYEQGIDAITHGATLLTHLFNAMNPFHHRKPGLVGLLSSETKLANLGFQRPFYSLIVDGIHVHESAVCMAYSSHPEGCVLVTDAMSAMGLGDGKFDLGNMSVTIKGDRATLTGTETLAGAVVSMDKCVRRFQKFTGCTVGEALLCATLHPANVLSRGVTREGTPPIGVLEVGARADLTLVTDQVDVVATWVHGRLAYGGLKI